MKRKENISWDQPEFEKKKNCHLSGKYNICYECINFKCSMAFSRFMFSLSFYTIIQTLSEFNHFIYRRPACELDEWSWSVFVQRCLTNQEFSAQDKKKKEMWGGMSFHLHVCPALTTDGDNVLVNCTRTQITSLGDGGKIGSFHRALTMRFCVFGVPPHGCKTRASLIGAMWVQLAGQGSAD